MNRWIEANLALASMPLASLLASPSGLSGSSGSSQSDKYRFMKAEGNLRAKKSRRGRFLGAADLAPPDQPPSARFMNPRGCGRLDSRRDVLYDAAFRRSGRQRPVKLQDRENGSSLRSLREEDRFWTQCVPRTQRDQSVVATQPPTRPRSNRGWRHEADADLHALSAKRKGAQGGQLSWATPSISTLAPLGSEQTSIQTRAGGAPGKNSA